MATSGKQTSRAGNTTKKTSTTAKKTTHKNNSKSNTRSTGASKARTQTSKKSSSTKERMIDTPVLKEVFILLLLALAIIMELSVFNIGSSAMKGFLFGTFGFTAYIFPIYLFFGIVFYLANNDNPKIKLKIFASLLVYCCICSMLQMMSYDFNEATTLPQYYESCKTLSNGGGIIGGAICKLICPIITTVGNYVLCTILLIIGMVIITERSFLQSLRFGGAKVYNTAKEDLEKIKESNRIKHEEQAEAQQIIAEKKRAEASRRMERRARGVEVAELSGAPKEHMKEITGSIPFEPAYASSDLPGDIINDKKAPKKSTSVTNNDNVTTETVVPPISVTHSTDIPVNQGTNVDAAAAVAAVMELEREEQLLEKQRADVVQEMIKENTEQTPFASKGSPEPVTEEELNSEAIEQYVFPPYDLLKSGTNKKTNMTEEVNETALKLQQTLRNFGVGVTITNVSFGPSVTRYELQPEQGVKVSKIVGLADDIKLNLAAADIRIEAPIPGKAAVGIEVPNKENTVVMFRDLIESEQFKNHSSNIAFAVGKDIGGQTVVTDIAKMPHLLIAGATGSGKSVCINTLIMSILYKANPNDVKLIMVDPKVVELSVYNGIPHLLIPVVTDPKKAAGALNWAVAEMTDRYKKFSELNVRDLKGYNEKIEAIKDIEDENKPKKLPQIVIIVDELADLMMVAPGEVEDAICRLAQMARAAGLHLIIATQRPSVNVITGLIKANVPSRIAFSVSSGVDSRTIIDMNGAEKLLGKGDMLFYPSGYPKPVRIQGAFVSDKEVASVVKFLADQCAAYTTARYNEEVNNKISNIVDFGSASGKAGNDSDRDIYFGDAGRFILEKEKASIGLLQREFKIGFNRAARIMDQLFDAGLVGPEEGTKPRKILMTREEFEELLRND